ncbi:single-stranded-DNA-specific exonuclease RecJ [candidate division KSB1 bacterium]|nr:single-stranded-DNA-specific exonuclease RecJ [candidate division KSB1 bacterium]
MKLQWILNTELENDEIEKLAGSVNVSPIIARILLNRGITDFECARHFFRADLDELHDPFLMRDMEKAVERVIRAIQTHEQIMIYGDYDVDGITAVSLLVRAMRDELGVEPAFYIPDRLREGYGLSEQGILEARQRGVTLIISVDCGITGHEEIAQANAFGIDVVVVDHHESGPVLPTAYAILDPKCEGETYPFKELAGVGVAYKLLQGMFTRLNLNPELLRKYTELVAIGSAADIVPLVDENRIFVRAGLKELALNRNVGLRALIDCSGLKNKPIGAGQVVFILAPRINAVGRLGDAERAVRLLTTNNPQQAQEIAGILEIENRNRKEIDEKTFKEALEMIEQQANQDHQLAFVLNLEGWHPGVIGIVASRIVEKYYRPTILIAMENGVGKGSARSIPGFDLYEALKECRDLMIGFGGHKYAAGLTIRSQNLEAFQKRFLEVTQAHITEDTLVQKLRIDSELRLGQIDGKFLNIIKQFAPFGPQNMRPVFVARNLEVVGTPSIVGKNHLKFKVRHDSATMDAIGFNLGHLIYRLAPGEKNLDMAFVIDENTWLGRTIVQLRVKDLI